MQRDQKKDQEDMHHPFQDAPPCTYPKPGATWDEYAWSVLARRNQWQALKDPNFKTFILPFADKIEAFLKHAAASDKSADELFDPLWNEIQKTTFKKAWDTFKNNPTHFKSFLLKCPSLLHLGRDAYQKSLYRGAEKNLAAAVEFHKHGITQAGFDDYFKCMRNHKKHDNIPDILMTCKDIGYDEGTYYLTKLSSTDPKMATVGCIVGCCHHIEGNFLPAVQYSIENPNSGLYVIRKFKKIGVFSEEDPIVSYTWVWKSHNNAVLVLDSIEFLKKMGHGETKDVHFKQNIDIWLALYRKLAEVLVKNPEYGIFKVTVGGGHTPPRIGLSGGSIFTLAKLPADYYAVRYSSAKNRQRLLAIRSFPLSALYTLNVGDPENNPTREKAKKELDDFMHSENAMQFIQFIIMDCDLNKNNLDHVTGDLVALDVINTLHTYLVNDQQKEFFEKCCRIRFSKDGNDAVDAAATAGNIKHIQWLMQYGVDLHAQETKSIVLDKAVKEDWRPLIEWLVREQGFRGDVKNQSGKTALFIAAEYNREATVKFFIEEALHSHQPLDLNAKNPDGDPLLHIVTRKNNLNLLRFLTQQKGMQLHILDEEGHTAFHIAAMYNHWDIFKCLVETQVEQGMDLNIKDKNQETLLQLAAYYKQWGVVAYLIQQKNIILDAPNMDGDTVSDLAARSGKEDIVRSISERLEAKPRCNLM